MNMNLNTAIVIIIAIVLFSIVSIVVTNSYSKSKITDPEIACYAYAKGNAQFKMCADIYSKADKKND